MAVTAEIKTGSYACQVAAMAVCSRCRSPRRPLSVSLPAPPSNTLLPKALPVKVSLPAVPTQVKVGSGP
jgi:hypothetical protein